MKQIIPLLIVTILILSCKSSSLENSTNNTIALFNGENLNGWSTHGTEKWYVKNGLLVGKNGNDQAFGYLKTIESYKDFELTFDFKLSKKGNSGVFIHSSIGNDIKVDGWQVEIGPPGHSLGGIHKYDKGWIKKPSPDKDTFYKELDWNTMKITVKNNSITTWLNNVKMATIIDPKLIGTTGAIALQIHNGNKTKIEWRNIDLIKL